MNSISVLIVDDSVLMRKLVGKIIEQDDELEIAAKAMNGRFALQKMKTHKPDVIVLDIEMPDMNGIEFLKEKNKMGSDIPVIILSSVATKGAAVTMEALALGACDFITKPSGSVSLNISEVGEQLTNLIKAYGRDYLRRHVKPLKAEAKKEIPAFTPKPLIPSSEVKVNKDDWESVTPETKHGKFELLAIGISTGGPNALRQVFAQLPADFPLPVVVVQHMPAGFTREFAKGLDRICPLEVKEAENGDILKKGRILIAPGDKHIQVEKRSLAGMVRLLDSDLVSGHRPSVDVLFESVAKEYGRNSLAVIMTGMGKDGARQIGQVYKRGGYTIAQDKDSSIVYGMPKVAFEHGYIHEQVSLKGMPDLLSRLAGKSS